MARTCPDVLTNMVLLWSSIYIFACKVFKQPLARYALILAPYAMWIRIYAGYIWKDTLLAFGYIFLCAVLCWKQQQKARFLRWEGIGFWILLLYCTELRWTQTRFICPLLILWFVHVQWTFWPHFKQKIVTACLSIGLIFGIYPFHQNMLHHTFNKATYYWQYVNIYDLAGMSIYSNPYLVPNFLVRKPGPNALKKNMN